MKKRPRLATGGTARGIIAAEDTTMDEARAIVDRENEATLFAFLEAFGGASGRIQGPLPVHPAGESS